MYRCAAAADSKNTENTDIAVQPARCLKAPSFLICKGLLRAAQPPHSYYTLLHKGHTSFCADTGRLQWTYIVRCGVVQYGRHSWGNWAEPWTNAPFSAVSSLHFAIKWAVLNLTTLMFHGIYCLLTYFISLYLSAYIQNNPYSFCAVYCVHFIKHIVIWPNQMCPHLAHFQLTCWAL